MPWLCKGRYLGGIQEKEILASGSSASRTRSTSIQSEKRKRDKKEEKDEAGKTSVRRDAGVDKVQERRKQIGDIVQHAG